ncbi:MAG: 50S ribosomal protein L23 [Patescibacteria group bacterium]
MSTLKNNTKDLTTDGVEAVEVVAAEPKAKKVATKKPAKKAEKVVATPKPVGRMVSARTAATLLAPLVTEKTAHLADAGVYAFLVPVTANRVAVGQAFRDMYKAAPVKVNIIRVHGKEHRFGTVTSRQSDWKKALVTVKKGTRIDIFEKI